MIAIPPEPDLHACLQQASWRHLSALMASHQLLRHRDYRRADLVALLHDHLSQTDVLRRIVETSDLTIRQALNALLQADGALPLHSFQASFGEIRLHRPWDTKTEPHQPWRSPVSPAETLYYLGLVFLHPRQPQPGQSQRAILPADLIATLRQLVLPDPATAPALSFHPRPGLPPDLAWHMALFLATLTAEPIHPLHGRWLPPSTLSAFAQRTGLVYAPGFTPTRSERRQPYLAFIHFLAEAAGFLAGVERLELTPLAWRWLAAGPVERWQTLWQSWLQAPSELALLYRFPWADLSIVARDLIYRRLQQLPAGAAGSLPDFSDHLRRQDERNLLAQPWDQEEDVISALLSGPCFWLRVIDLYATANTAGIDSFTLTPFGAWLLGMPGYQAPSFPDPQPCLPTATDNTRLLVPAGANPLHLAHLAPYCQWLTLAAPSLAQQLELTEATVAGAVAQGVQPAQILHALADALGRSPSHRLQVKIRQWAAKGQAVRVRQVTILETKDPQLMGDLRRYKLVRRHLGEALSPTRSVLNPLGLPALRTHLASLGWYVRIAPTGAGDDDPLPPLLSAQEAEAPQAPLPGIETATEDETSSFISASSDPVSVSAADAGLLWMTGLVYQGLGAHLPLPLPLSAALMDALAAELAPEQRAAAEFLAGQVQDQLVAALDGYLGHPAWMQESPAADPMPLIEQALAQDDDLILTYWSQGHEQKRVRRVTPYWIEQRHSIYYLVAYCHLRNEERVFRIDRILACHLRNRSEEPDTE